MPPHRSILAQTNRGFLQHCARSHCLCFFSSTSVRGAEEVGAADVPPAALQLQLAREEVAKAKKLMADGDNERAHYMALRAGNDAELAIVLVREAKARSEAANAAKRVESAKATEATQ